MRRLFLAALVGPLLLAAPSWASDIALGRIVSSGSSTTNLSTATPFHLQTGLKVSIQCDAAVYVAEGTGETPPTVTSTNGLRIEQYALFDVDLRWNVGSPPELAVGILPVSGSANCTVFLSYP